jgi:hypothetical protein
MTDSLACGQKNKSRRDAGATKNPLDACLGRARVSIQWVYRFSLLTLLFSGVFVLIKPDGRAKFRLIL